MGQPPGVLAWIPAAGPFLWLELADQTNEPRKEQRMNEFQRAPRGLCYIDLREIIAVEDAGNDDRGASVCLAYLRGGANLRIFADIRALKSMVEGNRARL